MIKKKIKRFSGEDGESEVIDLRDNKDSPTGIDDDVRARAKKFVDAAGKKDEEAEIPAPKAAVKKEVPKAAIKKEPPKPVEKPVEKPAASMTKSINPPKTSGMGAIMGALKSVRDKINSPVGEQAKQFRSASSRKEQAANPDKFVAPKYKSGGKVAGKLATRGYGKAR